MYPLFPLQTRPKGVANFRKDTLEGSPRRDKVVGLPTQKGRSEPVECSFRTFFGVETCHKRRINEQKHIFSASSRAKVLSQPLHWGVMGIWVAGTAGMVVTAARPLSIGGTIMSQNASQSHRSTNWFFTRRFVRELCPEDATAKRCVSETRERLETLHFGRPPVGFIDGFCCNVRGWRLPSTPKQR